MNPTLPVPFPARSKRLPFAFCLLAAGLMLVGCDRLDPYASKFEQIEIGAERAEVVDRLGPPSSVNSIEIPMMKIEQLAWRAPLGSRVYLVHTALGYVVSKSIVQ